VNSLLGGTALRCAQLHSSECLGRRNKRTGQIGYHQDLDKAKALLAKAGFPDGFEFKLSYGDARGVRRRTPCWRKNCNRIWRASESKVVLDPMDQVNLRTQYTTGKSSAVPDVLEPLRRGIDGWASAHRAARRETRAHGAFA